MSTMELDIEEEYTKGCTPLMEAARKGHKEMVTFLLSHGANVNATTATGDTALTYACENGHFDVADLLLQAEEELDGSVPSHELSQTLEAEEKCSVPEVVSYLAAPSTPALPLDSPSDLNTQTDSNKDTNLTLACAAGHKEQVSFLLSQGSHIEYRDKMGLTPLMLAATAGHVEVVEVLLNHSANIEAQATRRKDTALTLACSSGRYGVVDILLAHGANKEHRNFSDYTPLILAASGGFVNIVNLLLCHGAEIDSRTGSQRQVSPLCIASLNGHTEVVRLLLDTHSDTERKANIEHRTKTGFTPLMEAAFGGHVEVGKVLIDKGADVNAPPMPSSYDTALTIAASRGHYRFVQLLLERNAIVEVKNKDGNSPLWLAAHNGHLEVVRLLYAKNADIHSQNNEGESCLVAAFCAGRINVVKWMVKHVSQFPSDHEMDLDRQYLFECSDTVHPNKEEEIDKNLRLCEDIIRIARDGQHTNFN